MKSSSILTLLSTAYARLISASEGALSVFNEGSCDKTHTCFNLDEKSSFGWNFLIDEEVLDIGMNFNAAGDGWLGIGFAPTQTMENADIYYCKKFGTEVGLVSAFSARNTKPIEYEDPVGILERSVGTTMTNSSFSCSFKRPIRIVKEEISYDLSTQNFFILTAAGSQSSLTTSGTQYHSLRQSVGRVNVTESSFNVPQPQQNFQKTARMIVAHGCMLLAAWGLLAPLAVMATTVGRKSMPLSKIGETHTWFLIHRGVMILVLMLTISGVTLIFVAREGWSESAGPHAYLGVVCLALSVINALLGMFRPSPDSERRVVFNWTHFSVGQIGIIFGFASCFTGLKFFINFGRIETWVFNVFVAAVTIHTANFIVAKVSNTLEKWSTSLKVIFTFFIFVFMGLSLATLIPVIIAASKA